MKTISDLKFRELVWEISENSEIGIDFVKRNNLKSVGSFKFSIVPSISKTVKDKKNLIAPIYLK